MLGLLLMACSFCPLHSFILSASCCLLLCFLQGPLPHAVELREGAFEQLKAASEFNQGLILPLAEHAARIAPQVAATVAEAVARLDLRLDPNTEAQQQQQLAQGCVRELFGSFCSEETIEAITVVRTRLMQQRCQLTARCMHASLPAYSTLHACLRQCLGCLQEHTLLLLSPLVPPA
jgi:hypothetical protein